MHKYIPIVFSLQMSNSNNKKSTYNKLTELEQKLDGMIANDKKISLELLHRYNEIKDATQVVIQHIANMEETTVTEVHRRLGLED